MSGRVREHIRWKSAHKHALYIHRKNLLNARIHRNICPRAGLDQTYTRTVSMYCTPLHTHIHVVECKACKFIIPLPYFYGLQYKVLFYLRSPVYMFALKMHFIKFRILWLETNFLVLLSTDFSKFMELQLNL